MKKKIRIKKEKLTLQISIKTKSCSANGFSILCFSSINKYLSSVDNFANEIDNAWSAMGSLIFWPTFIKFLTRSSKFVVSLLRKENVKSKKQNENKTKNKNLKKN